MGDELQGPTLDTLDLSLTTEINDDSPWLPQRDPPLWQVTPLPRPRPHGIVCKVVDKGVEAALRRVLDVPQAREMRRRLTDEAVRRCNALDDAEQVVLGVTMIAGGAAYIAMDFENIVEKLGNKTFRVPLPIKEAGIPGRLDVRIHLEEFEPVGGALRYSHSHDLWGGRASWSATAGTDRNGDEEFGVFFRWSIDF